VVRRTIQLTTFLFALVPVSAVDAATSPVAAPEVEKVLVAAGYPARSQCGMVMVPPRRLVVGQVFRARGVSTCWVVVEREGYSVHVTPYTTARLAKVAYERTRNPAAPTTRKAAIGNVVLTAYRLPPPEWLHISKLVASALDNRR
jgi:hypothetical protein